MDRWRTSYGVSVDVLGEIQVSRPQNPLLIELVDEASSGISDRAPFSVADRPGSILGSGSAWGRGELNGMGSA